MAIIAGMDEAGLGPIIGPLVVSVSVFDVPDSAADACMWEALAGAVTRKAFRRSPAVPIADSKAMHVRTDGLVHLERGVLGMLAQMPPAPRSLRELLRRCAPGTLDQMPHYRWYAGADLPLPRQADADDLRLRAGALTKAMAKRGVELRSIRVEPVLAGDLNRLLHATGNKSVAAWGVASRLIAYVFATHAGEGITRIIVDRQGGRIRYLANLQRMFEGARIRIVEESQRRSVYTVAQGRRQAEIRFVTKGEDAAMPVAVASMVSKYTRELFMELLNDWWGRHVSDLKPTAGYYVDGRRFLQDISPAVAAQGIDTELLVRSR